MNVFKTRIRKDSLTGMKHFLHSNRLATKPSTFFLGALVVTLLSTALAASLVDAQVRVTAVRSLNTMITAAHRRWCREQTVTYVHFGRFSRICMRQR